MKKSEFIYAIVVIKMNFTTKLDAAGKVTGEEFNGFTLKHAVTVDSKNINKIEKLFREITELI